MSLAICTAKGAVAAICSLISSAVGQTVGVVDEVANQSADVGVSRGDRGGQQHPNRGGFTDRVDESLGTTGAG
ncbi:hypothetical protein [Nocardia sp. NPDC005745]|uniref:hypothetical protein n=1 Tax=Nocardia sp. NPDC005745 TaxID=3157061 RepID=UPI0033DE08C4